MLSEKQELLKAYSEENLNAITAKILLLYKNKHFEALKKLSRVVNHFMNFPFTDSPKLFSKLIMLYHPDKQKTYHQSIQTIQLNEDLSSYVHIIPVLELIKSDFEGYTGFKTPEEFEQEYGWNYQSTDDDYFIVREDDETVQPLFDEENPAENYYFSENENLPEGSFLASLKRKIYGPTAMDFPTYLLEDLEEIEMAEYEIESLDGVEYCVHAKIMDLSYNQLFDITSLEHCTYIQELYLANNQIHYIDALFHIQDLRVLDLSNNQIEDVGVLYHLKCLEFVNLLGNPVPHKQIEKLKSLGIAVVV